MANLTSATEPASQLRVIVYSTGASCGRCQVTCLHLRKRGIAYDLIDLTLEINAPAREYVTDDLGYTEAPVVVVEGEPENNWSGFRPDLIDRLLMGARSD